MKERSRRNIARKSHYYVSLHTHDSIFAGFAIKKKKNSLYDGTRIAYVIPYDISFGHTAPPFPALLPLSSDHLFQSHQRCHGCRLYERARATTCSLLSLLRAAEGAPYNPRWCARSLGRPMLFSSAPLLSPPDKGGAE